MKKTRVKMEVTDIMDQTSMRSTILFSHTITMPLMKSITIKMMELLKIGNGNLSQIICKFLIYQIVMMVSMG